MYCIVDSAVLHTGGGKRCSDSGWHDQAKAIAQRASVRPCRVYGNQAAMLPCILLYPFCKMLWLMYKFELNK